MVIGGGLVVVLVFYEGRARPVTAAILCETHEGVFVIFVGLGVVDNLLGLRGDALGRGEEARMSREAKRTLRVGLLESAAFAGAACLMTISAGVTGDGRPSSTTLSFLERVAFSFSCELAGSGASLLGTGVTLLGRACLGLAIELDLVVSWRHGEDLSASFWAGLAAGVAPALEKKPRMLCCFPVEAETGFLAVDGVLAGVRASIVRRRLRMLGARSNLRSRANRNKGHGIGMVVEDGN